VTDFDPVRDHAALHALQDELDALATRDPAELATVVAERSGWSSEHHLAHVALANELVLRNVASIAGRRGALLTRAEPEPRALAVLRDGRIPRGRAQSPRMVRPPEHVQRELLLTWLADGRKALAALDPRTLVAGELRIPHQLLGPLDGPQWLRFGVVHTGHHMEIVREILATLATPR